jgi:hypothetical protein
MPYFTVDEEVFQQVHSALNLELSVNLFTDIDPPEGLVEGIKNQGSSAMLDEQMAKEDAQKIIDSIMAAYSPLLNDDDELEEHAIWVRPTRVHIRDMNISFLHELIHASQMESFGFARYQEMDNEYMKTVGYEKNPFEMEADFMSHFMVLELKMAPFVQIEVEED